jgi:hypothetical protein
VTHGEGVNTDTAARWRRLVALALLLLAAGCTTQFLYNRLNFVIPWYVRERVTLEDDQIEALKSSVRSLTAWHRQSQLPRYSDFLRQASEQVRRPVSLAQMEATSREIDGFWNDIVAALAPDASRWLRALSPAQLQELLDSFAEEDEQISGHYCEASDEELNERRTKSIARSVKYWTGSLEDVQMELIERSAANLERTGCDWVASRARWRAELKRLLAENDAPAAFEAQFRELMLHPERTWTDGYRRGEQANRERFMNLLAELDTTMTAKQRERASRKLAGLASDLDELAARADD